MKALWGVLLLSHGLLIGWAVARYLDGIPRECWVALGASSAALCAASLLLDLNIFAIVAAAATGIYFAMASPTGAA